MEGLENMTFGIQNTGINNISYYKLEGNNFSLNKIMDNNNLLK